MTFGQYLTGAGYATFAVVMTMVMAFIVILGGFYLWTIGTSLISRHKRIERKIKKSKHFEFFNKVDFNKKQEKSEQKRIITVK